MNEQHVIVVGGGPAGFFAAIACASASPHTRVTLLERGSRFLDKVRISGGGRCNVTNACPDPREFAAHYPRGGPALLGPFRRFSAPDTVEWFAAHGVRLKTESDGRMFPVTDSSRTIVNCLVNAARAAGVSLRRNCGVESVTRLADGRFELRLNTPKGDPLPQGRFPRNAIAPGALESGRAALPRRQAERQLGPTRYMDREPPLVCDRLLLATGGCRGAAAGQLAVALGHTLEPPVPSLFTFQIQTPWLRSLAGVAVAPAEISAPASGLRERGPLLVTHQGLSGPAVLRLSAWGARALHALNYRFPLRVNWLPELSAEQMSAALDARRQSQPARRVASLPLAPLPARLWEQLVQAAGIARDTRWAALSRSQAHALTQQLARTELPVSGRSLNRDEFVTCGGVRLAEVNFKTMESRLCPGLFFAGELLDVDGVTGGFNFQAAWTTGFIAGRAMAEG